MPSSHRTTRTKDSVEDRRARGEISCAECRRHKLKCNKSIPCSTCVRKGCSSICPNGTLAASHGSRLSATGAPGTDALTARISEMSKRIRQLEDALQICHGSTSPVQHPLLAEDLLGIKSGSSPSVSPKDESDTVDSELLSSFGTLAVTNRGTESYIGGPNAILVRHLGSTDLHLEIQSCLELPAPITYLSKIFPFTPLYLPAQEIQAYIEEKLPSYARASALAEAYLENLSWFFRPVDREQIMEELIPEIYKRRRRTSGKNGSGSSQSSSSDGQSQTDPHVLALLLAVFASGAAADLTLPPWNDESDLYYHLARTALSLKPVFDGAGLHAVQTVALIGAYDLFSCRKDELEGSWKIISFSMSLAASIGLNRDPAHFKLSPKIIQRRRRVFWELASFDVWKSLSSGRPLTFMPAVIDCEFPDDTDAKYSDHGSEMPSSIWRIRIAYIKDILTEVVCKLGEIRPIKYSEILALDQKIREYDPDGMFSMVARSYGSQQFDRDAPFLVKQVQLGLLKDITLLLLHRSFFVRAILEDPVNPIRTQFGPSFLSTYRSAASFLRVVRDQFEHSGHFLMRIWPIWAHALCSAVMLGSIAACGSAAALAPQAFVDFELAFKMLGKAQMHPLVKAGLPILMRLHEQAQEALAKHGNSIPLQPSSTVAAPPKPAKVEEFNGIRSMGRMVRSSLQGEYGARPTRLRDTLSGRVEVQTIPPSFTAGQYSMPFTGNERPYRRDEDDFSGFATLADAESEASFESGGSPYQRANPDARTTASPKDLATGDASSEYISAHGHSGPHSPAQTSLASPAAVRLGERHGATFMSEDTDPTLMQVDYNVYYPQHSSTENAPGANRQFFDTARFAAHPTSPTSPDPFSAYTTFADMSVADNTPGPSSGPISGYPHSHIQVQRGSNSQPAFYDPSTYSTPSWMSPDVAFDSDFDVSFDMRASTGLENVVPLLSPDMEAWRTILQDSRFFGIANNAPESEQNTPPAM